MGDDGAKAISKMLRMNTTLTALDMDSEKEGRERNKRQK